MIKDNSYALRKLTKLQDEIISEIPESVLSDPSTTYLVCDGAGGQEAKGLIDELRKRGFLDSDISSRIYVIFEDEFSRDFAVNMNGIIGNLIVREEGFLGLQVRNKLLFFTINKKHYSMNFGVILGNPPYKGEGNDKSPSRLWHKFIKKAREVVKEDGYLSFVVPSFYTQVGEGYKIFESSVTSKNLLIYRHKGRAFEGVGIDVCYFLEQNKPYQGNTFFNGKSHDFRNGFIYEGDDAIIKSIIDKVIENGKPKLKLEWVKRDKKECNLDGIGIPVYFSGRKKKWVDEPVGHIDPKGRGVLDSTSWKVIFPCSSSYKGQFVTTESACMLNYYVKVSSELEGNQIMSYTTLPPMVKIASLYKKTSGFTPLVQHRMIPDLERKFWTVEEFYKYHDLTEEEIRVLNS